MSADKIAPLPAREKGASISKSDLVDIKFNLPDSLPGCFNSYENDPFCKCFGCSIVLICARSTNGKGD